MSKSASLTTVISPVFTEVRICKCTEFISNIENGIQVPKPGLARQRHHREEMPFNGVSRSL